MEKNDNLSLRRNRSIQAVLGDGLRLYGKNFLALIRSSWIQAIVYAAVVGVTMAYFFTYILPDVADGFGTVTHLFAVLGMVAAFAVVAWVFAFAGGVAPLLHHSTSDTIAPPRRWWGRWPWRLTLRGLVRLPKMFITMVRRRQLPQFMAVGMVLLLLVVIATLLLQLPAVVMVTANVAAASDTVSGDTVTMPDNLFAMNLATFAICGFIQAYIHLATLFPIYYIWGNALVNTDKNNQKK